MSADNGVYVASFPTIDGGVEYRVAHCQAIDNVYFGTNEYQDAYRFLLFGSEKSFSNQTEAFKFAYDIENELDICEYGVCGLDFDRPLVMMTIEEANSIVAL